MALIEIVVHEPDDPNWHRLKEWWGKKAEAEEAERRASLTEALCEMEDALTAVMNEHFIEPIIATPNNVAQIEHVLRPHLDRLNAMPLEERLRYAAFLMTDDPDAPTEGLADASWEFHAPNEVKLNVRPVEPLERVDVTFSVTPSL